MRWLSLVDANIRFKTYHFGSEVAQALLCAFLSVFGLS